MRNVMKWLSVSLLVVMLFSCAGIPGGDTKSGFTDIKVQGFTQFDIYRSANMLGFVESGDKKFNFKVWEGLVYRDKLEQTIQIQYRGNSVFKFSSSFFKIASASLSNNQIVGVDLLLINPVEYSFKDPSPANAYVKRADFLKKKYIGSVLKVDEIQVKFVRKDGTTVSAEAAYKLIKGSMQYKIRREQNAVFFARDVFVGYKLYAPPERAAMLGAFTLEYQFLYQPPGKAHWQLVESHDAIQSGGNLKFRLRCSHAAHVYVFNLDSGGNVYTLFPNDSIEYKSPLVGGRTYFFPKNEAQAFAIDAVKGIEEFVIMVFREDPPGMPSLLDRINGKKMSRTLFNNDALVVNSRGVSQIRLLKVQSASGVPGFSSKVRQIRGLSADYREILLLRHE